MNRISRVFADGRKAFVGYLTAGHKGIEYSFKSSLAMIKGGVDILEIGIPFSDPVADGPVIQKAMQDSLGRKTSFEDVFNLVKRIRVEKSDVPIVLFSYLNPIMKIGSDFYRKTAESGADALLIVDMPLEESEAIHSKCREFGLELIFIISPSTPKKRIKKIVKRAGGFLYYVCRKGTTGIKSSLPEGFEEKIKEIKSVSNLPVVGGFGISTKEMAEQIAKETDGSVVGSFFVSAMENMISEDEISALAKTLKPD